LTAPNSGDLAALRRFADTRFSLTLTPADEPLTAERTIGPSPLPADAEGTRNPPQGSVQVSPHNPFSFAIVALLFFTVALVACFIPGRWGMRLNPLDALRQE
jgi:hypothetical protein